MIRVRGRTRRFVATATAAPIPQHMYDREKECLNELRRQRRRG